MKLNSKILLRIIFFCRFTDVPLAGPSDYDESVERKEKNNASAKDDAQSK